MYNSGCYDNYFIAYLLWPWHSFSIDILFTSPTLEFNHTNCPKEKKSWLLHTYQLKKRTMSGYPWTLQRRGWDGRHVLSRWWFFRSKGGVGNVLNLRAMPFADEHLQHLWRREISKTTAIGWLEHLREVAGQVWVWRGFEKGLKLKWLVGMEVENHVRIMLQDVVFEESIGFSVKEIGRQTLRCQKQRAEHGRRPIVESSRKQTAMTWTVFARSQEG